MYLIKAVWRHYYHKNNNKNKNVETNPFERIEGLESFI